MHWALAHDLCFCTLFWWALKTVATFNKNCNCSPPILVRSFLAEEAILQWNFKTHYYPEARCYYGNSQVVEIACFDDPANGLALHQETAVYPQELWQVTPFCPRTSCWHLIFLGYEYPYPRHSIISLLLNLAAIVERLWIKPIKDILIPCSPQLFILLLPT